MNRNKRNIIGAVLVVLLALVALPLTAHALGTAAGTDIGNTASVVYSVGSVTQPAISTGPTATFTVDNKVNLTVTSLGNATVVPGSADQVLAFTVTNNGNTTQAYGLSVVSRATDSFDMSNIRIYRDVNNSGTLDGGDTLYVDPTTFGNLVSDATFTVLVVADTPAGQTNGETAVQDLLATTYDAGGAVVTAQTTTPTAGVDVVFADIAGSATGDVARDGRHSAVGTYTANAAAVSITKTAAIYSDPFNLTTNPKAIPGAVITYTITVSNAAGGANATNVTISDAMPANVTFAPSFDDGVNICGGAEGVVVNGTCNTNAGGDDNADYAISTPGTVTVGGLTVNAGSSATVKFQVIIN